MLESKRRGESHCILPDCLRSSSIYRHLARHYILRRSVVFIVDNYFDSMVYQDLAFCTIEHVFKRLDGDDYFGFIPLRPSNEGGY